MGGLIKAEFRKIFSTHMWWVLLVCTAALGVLWSSVFALFGSALADQLAKQPLLQGSGFESLPYSVFGFARAVNISAVFPMILGGLAISGENFRRTITTSYLTAPSRGAVLSAKLAVYAMIGVVYGILISGAASAGIAIGAHSAQLPDAQGWSMLFVTGVVSSLLWTLLGVGVGALFGNVFATIFGLIGYTVVLENSVLLVLPEAVRGFLPNNAGDALNGAVAAQYIFDSSGTLGERLAGNDTTRAVVEAAAGSSGGLPWWASGLVFAGYTAIFVVGGWMVSRYRDVN